MVLVTMSSLSSQAQLGQIANGIADKRRQKKIEKSPATDHIIAVEKYLPILQKEFDKWKNPSERFPKDDEEFEKFNQPFSKIEENLALIIQKDPNWDVSEYNTQFDKQKPIFKSIETNYGKRLKAMALTDSVNNFPNPRNDFRFGYNKSCDDLFETPKYYNVACDCGEQHYDSYVNQLNLKKLRVTLSELAPIIKYLPYPSSYNSIKEPHAKRLIKKYLDGFDNLQNYWLESASKAIESSKTHDNKFQSMGVLKYCLKIMETAIEISDVRKEEFEAKKIELNQRLSELQKERLIENKITTENEGKIFFLSSEVSRDKFTESMAISTWDVNQAIYFRWFMPNTPQEMHQKLDNAESGLKANHDAYMTHVFYINGRKFHTGIYDGFRSNPELYADALTMRGRYNSDKGIYIDLMQKVLQNLGPGTYDMRIEAFMDGHEAQIAETPFAIGELKLKVTSGGLSKIKSNPEVCFQKTGMQNAQVTQQIKLLLKEELDGLMPSSARIISKDWVVERNKYSGAILSRGVNVLVLFGGTNCKKMEVWVEQDYNGNGHYAPLKINGISETFEIPCECMN